MLQLKTIPSKNNIKSAMCQELIFNLQLLIADSKENDISNLEMKNNSEIKTWCLNTNCYFVTHQKAFFKNKTIFPLKCKPGYNVCKVCYNIVNGKNKFSELKIMNNGKVEFIT